jgi:endonuclease YncB( thermonuclease family)
MMGTVHKFSRRRKSSWSKLPLTVIRGLAVVLSALVVIGLLSYRTPQDLASLLPWSNDASFSLCFTGAGFNCVVDGDTFWAGGRKIRISDIDAPETHPSRCPREAYLGKKATLRLQELLNQGPVTLEPVSPDTDRYGRALRRVTRNGRSLGSILVSEGLARDWAGYRQPWC